jgi:subtilisin family serine protease
LTQYSKSYTLEKGWDNVDWNEDDTNGHGTWVTSVILGYSVPSNWGFTNNYVLGVAPKAQIIMLRVLGNSPNLEASVDVLVEGINYARNLHSGSLADKNMVLSMSLGWSSSVTPSNEQNLINAITNARNDGIPVVVANGNYNPFAGITSTAKPALFDDSTSVQAATLTGYDTDYSYTHIKDDIVEGDFSALKLASFAVSGKVEITAIGDRYYLPEASGSFSLVKGTSFACPQISGVFALLFSKYGSRTVDYFETLIMDSAYYMSPLDTWGAGFAQADDALGIHDMIT